MRLCAIPLIKSYFNVNVVHLLSCPIVVYCSCPQVTISIGISYYRVLKRMTCIKCYNARFMKKSIQLRKSGGGGCRKGKICNL